MPTLANFRIRFPEFVSIADDRIQLFIDDAIEDVSEIIWGRFYERGVYYLAAHYLTVAETQGSNTINAVTNKSVGSVSIGYAVNVSPDSINSTKYGQIYTDMRSKLLTGSGASLV